MLEDVTQIGMRVRAPIFWDTTSVRSLCYSVRVWAPRGEANDMLSPRPRPQITFSSGWAELGAILLGKTPSEGMAEIWWCSTSARIGEHARRAKRLHV